MYGKPWVSLSNRGNSRKSIPVIMLATSAVSWCTIPDDDAGRIRFLLSVNIPSILIDDQEVD